MVKTTWLLKKRIFMVKTNGYLRNEYSENMVTLKRIWLLKKRIFKNMVT